MHEPPCHAESLHGRHHEVTGGEGEACDQQDAQERRQSRNPGDEVIAGLHEDEVAEVNAERRACQPREPCAGLEVQLAHDHEDRVGHHEDVDAREIPYDLKVRVVAREVVLQGDVSEGRDQVARNEHRDADGQCPAPVPCGREFHQVVCQH